MNIPLASDVEQKVLLEDVDCNFCGGTDKEIIFYGRDRTHHNVHHVSCGVVRCRRCGLVYLSPRIQERHIGIFYPKDEYYTRSLSAETRLGRFKKDLYFAIARRYYGYSGTGGPTRKSRSQWLAHKLAPLWHRIFPGKIRRLPPYAPQGRLLEFGFGGGHYLCKMKELGWECWGIEIAEESVALMRQKGIHAYGDLWHSDIPQGYFDWVSAYHSLEHVYDPKTCLARLFHVLKPGGRIFVGIPNFNSLAARLFRSFWYTLSVPVHLHFFSAPTAQRYLEQAGFRNVALKYYSLPNAFSGSLQYLADAAIEKIRRRKCRGKAIENSTLLNLLLVPGVKALDILGLGDRLELTAVKPG